MMRLVFVKRVVVESGSGSAYELSEEFASRRDFEMSVDREHMVMDGGFADLKFERDLFFGIARDQMIKNLESSECQRRERWFVGSGKIGTDFVVDRQMDQRDDGLLAGREISRADSFVQPERCASTGNVGWADGDDVVVDAALAVNIVVGVRTVPGFFAPDLVAREDQCFSRKLGKVRIFGGALNRDGLGVFSPAGFGFFGYPTSTVDAKELGFAIIGRAEVFDLGVDDDLSANEFAQRCEEFVTPGIYMSAQLAALPCELVAIMNISCGQVSEHLISPNVENAGLNSLNIPENWDFSQHNNLFFVESRLRMLTLVPANARINMELRIAMTAITASRTMMLKAFIHRPHCSRVCRGSLHKDGKSMTGSSTRSPIECSVVGAEHVIGPYGHSHRCPLEVA